MARAGQRVGHQSGQEAVYGAQQGEDYRGLQGPHQEACGGQTQLNPRQAGRHPPDGGRTVQPHHAQQRADGEPHQGSGQKFREAARPEHEGGERGGGDAKGVCVEPGQRLGQCENRARESAGRRRCAEKGQDLYRHDDDADAGHEARDDHVGRVDHEAPGPQGAQKHLQQTAQNDDDQGFVEVRRVGGDDDRHGDGHGRRGT